MEETGKRTNEEKGAGENDEEKPEAKRLKTDGALVPVKASDGIKNALEELKQSMGPQYRRDAMGRMLVEDGLSRMLPQCTCDNRPYHSFGDLVRFECEFHKSKRDRLWSEDDETRMDALAEERLFRVHPDDEPLIRFFEKCCFADCRNSLKRSVQTSGA
jgi:hypothetical protein